MGKNKYSFQKLTPIDDAKLDIYEDAIDFVFDNKDVKNIAVSGAYSSGKSSVIESYKKKHPSKRFLHISLAHFESDDEEKKDKDKKGKDEKEKDNKDGAVSKESVLEGKILNQLIHQINPDKIPQTNFKVKRKVDEMDIAQSVAVIMAFILMVFYLFSFSSWKTLVDGLHIDIFRYMLLLTTYNEFRLLVGFYSCFLFGIILYRLISIQKNKNIFRKVTVQGNEIEIFEESEDSYFDKYLNEVLYLFEHVDAEVIVFEDMDRYNANQIFERLREVNTLVNLQLEKSNKPVLRFFYLLRDDIFVSKDRTKFFDYNIPIVPVIDSSNSYDQFIEHLKAGEIFKLLDENFLQGLSLYVDDMRILKNIYNEFVIYNNKVNTTEQDCNKLLAIVTYKNLFPRDFSNLQLNRGFVYTIFTKKEELLQSEIEKINVEIAELENKINMAKNEHLESVQEVDLLYNPQIQNLRTYHHHNRVEKIKELEEKRDKRKEAIENRIDNKIDNLQSKIPKLEIHKQKLHDKKLHEVITRENIDNLFNNCTYVNDIGEENDFNEIKRNEYFDLIKYLIRDGFIDETYPDYMSYFYENSLSRIDKTFLRSVTDKKAKEYTYKLTDAKMVISRLKASDFDQEETLNFDLLCHILSNSIYDEQLRRFIQQLKETENYQFVRAFFESKREQNHFVKSINNNWTSFFADIIDSETFSKDQVKLYSICTLYYSSDKSIAAVNIDNCLAEYISNSSDYLNIQQPNMQKLIKGFKLINVSFESIEHDTANKDLFEAVYKESLYVLSYDHISLMLRVFYGVENLQDIICKNYSLVMTNPATPLAKYVNENINNYMGILLKKCENTFYDDEDVVISILNNEEILEDNKIAYINLLQTQIQVIDEISDIKLWNLLYNKKLVAYNENNILKYFFKSDNGLDKTLINFINSKNNNLNFSFIEESYSENPASDLFSAIIACNSLNNERYAHILKNLNRYYKDFSIEDIDNDKMEILIDLRKVRMNTNSLLFIRDNYNEVVSYYIEKNIQEYVDNTITSETFDFDEMLSVLEMEVNDDYKIKLLNFTDEPISIIRKDYPKSIKAHILKNNLGDTDLKDLLLEYSNESAEVKSIILELTIKNQEVITSERYPLSIELFERVLALDACSQETKVAFFICVLPAIDEPKCIEYLKKLEMTDYLKLFDKGRPKFIANDTNEQILTIFKQKHWITNFNHDKEDPDYFRAIGRKIND